MRAAGWAPCVCCMPPSLSMCCSSGQPSTLGDTQVATGQKSMTPSSQALSGSGKREPPEARSIIPGTPSCTRQERPRQCSGVQAPGWWSTAEALSHPHLPSRWQTPSSALRTSSPSSIPCAPTPRASSWKPMPSSALWAAEPGWTVCPNNLPPPFSSSLSGLQIPQPGDEDAGASSTKQSLGGSPRAIWVGRQLRLWSAQSTVSSWQLPPLLPGAGSTQCPQAPGEDAQAVWG